jgi:hypothetical protein
MNVLHRRKQYFKLFVTVLVSLFVFHCQTTVYAQQATDGQQTLPIADESKMEPLTQNESASETKGKLSYSGYFDTYYFGNLNNPATRNNLGSSGVARGFDRYVGQFQLGMFLSRINYSNDKAEVVGEIGFGPNVEYGSYGNDFRYKWGTVLANSTYSSLMIKQAYVTYKATAKLSITMGQFGTHIGYEYIDAPLNFNYSINNTFNSGIPFYHIGLKATYKMNDKISAMAGVVHGTDNMNDNNRAKSFIGQLSLTPREGLSIALNTIQGNEANARTNGQDTTSYFGVLDLVSTWQATNKILLGLWLMQGSLKGEYQGGAYYPTMQHWGGANLYVVYKFSEMFSLGTRLEYFDNSSGVRPLRTQGRGTDVHTYTLTGNLTLAGGNLLLKPEVRTDVFRKITGTTDDSKMQEFMDSAGNFSKNTQTTIGMAVIFKF